MGLKTTYYLRTLAASQVEKSTVNTAEYGSTHIRNPGIQAIPVKMEEEKKPEYKAKFAVYNQKAVEEGKKEEPKLCKILDPDCESCQ